VSKFILSAFADEIDMNLKVQMDVLDTHNIKFIEMRGVNGKGLVEHSIEEVKSIKKELDARGFKLSAIGSPLGKIKITDSFEPHLELFKHTLEIAKVMNAKYIRMFSFFIPEGENPEKYRDEVMYRWRKFIETAEDAGVILLHENEKDIYGDTPERCLDLLKSMNCSYMKATFDPANFVQCDVATYPEAYELLKDYIEYVHIKDALYINHHVVPAGMGDGNVKDLLVSLYDSGFSGFLSLEPHLAHFDGFGALEKNSVGFDLPEGGARSFAIAVEALKKILCEIGPESLK
jgi:sugar phosphate isomerase/epimerase